VKYNVAVNLAPSLMRTHEKDNELTSLLLEELFVEIKAHQ
jgi:hypothetical protein